MPQLRYIDILLRLVRCIDVPGNMRADVLLRRRRRGEASDELPDPTFADPITVIEPDMTPAWGFRWPGELCLFRIRGTGIIHASSTITATPPATRDPPRPDRTPQ